MNNRNIKIKEKTLKPIKKLDRYQVYTKKLKNNVVNLKNKSNYNSDEENSPTEYGENKIVENTNIIFRNATNKFNEYGKKSFNYTTKNVIQTKNKISEFKTRIKNKSLKTKIDKVTPHKIKNDKKAIKSFEIIESTKKKQLKEKIINGRKKAYVITKAMAKKSVESIKIATKTMISTVKMIITATNALIAFLIAGGWITILIITIITLIALLCGSIFGIFFSSESNFSDRTMNSVINEINIEFTSKITEIQNNTLHDEFRIHSDRAEWKDILSVYVALISNGEDGANVITLDENKINYLKKIFWEMNTINSRVDVEIREIEITDEKRKNQKTKGSTQNIVY